MCALPGNRPALTRRFQTEFEPHRQKDISTGIRSYQRRSVRHEKGKRSLGWATVNGGFADWCCERFVGGHGAGPGGAGNDPGNRIGAKPARRGWLYDGRRFGGAAWRRISLEPAESDQHRRHEEDCSSRIEERLRLKDSGGARGET